MLSVILDAIRNNHIFSLHPEQIKDRNMTKEEFVSILNHFNAFWQYQGEPSPDRPHAILKSGKHSNGFIACKEVLKYPVFTKLFAAEIFKTFYGISHPDYPKIDVVLSSAYSAITLGYELARQFSTHDNNAVEYIIVEKDEIPSKSVCINL